MSGVKKLKWQKVITREYTCLWASYTMNAYKVQENLTGTTLRYNLFHGQGKLLTIYRIPEDVQRSYKLIQRICQHSPSVVAKKMDVYDKLLGQIYQLFKEIKAAEGKSKIKSLLLELDRLFIKIVCYYLFFVFLGYAGNLPSIKKFLKRHSERFVKIRQYSIDRDMNREFPKLFSRYDKRLNNLSAYMTRDELVDFVRGEMVDLRKIGQRKREYLFLMKPNEITEYNLKEIKRVLSRELSYLRLSSKNYISGQIACRGKASGLARLIFTEDDYKKIKPGDILITPMTKPPIAPYLSKVKAIVTNDGGALSHASIISREMNIPCVTGTKYATDIFKDRDRVEVDADKGLVKKLIST